MKKSFFVICVFLTFASISYTDTCFAYGSQGYGDPNRKDYYDEWGRHQGHSKLDPYSGKTNHYDDWGRNQGHSKKDAYSGEVKHYDEWGRLQGTTR